MATEVAARRPAISSPSLAARCRRKFMRFFPRGFVDETYLSWERDYKHHAHEQWETELGRDTFGALLREGRHYRGGCSCCPHRVPHQSSVLVRKNGDSRRGQIRTWG